MRKIISTMMLVAAAAMASVSCQKENTHSRVENGYISFISTNPETRTEWNGQTVVWSVDDVIRVACQQDGTWYTSGAPSKAKLYVSETLSADALAEGAESVQFKVKTGNNAFPADLTGILQFYALYPSNVADASFDQDTSCESVKIAVEQKVSSSTYDRSCDIMWGKATTTCGAMPTGPVPIVWNRVVAHANISLNKIEGIVTGEKINKITLTAQEGAALAGTFNLNMATGEFSAQSTSNTITLTCDDIMADASGNVEFWACVNPCTLTELDIEVDTDKAVYTIKKTGFSRDFKVNQRNILPINMSEATRTEKEVLETNSYYVKVTEAPADGDWSGQYLLVCESRGEVMGTLNSDYCAAVSHNISDNRIMSTSENFAYQLVITRHTQNDWYAISVDSKYFGTKSDKSTSLLFSDSISADNSSYWWTISINSQKNVEIANVLYATRFLKRSSTNTTLRFAAYTTTGKAVQLYKLQSN